MAGEVLTMIEADLGVTIESDFASRVILIPPTGTPITTSLHGGPLYGRFTRDFQDVTPEGDVVTVFEPMLILRLSSLSRVPAPSENWAIRVERSPGSGTYTTYKLGATRAPQTAQSIGFIRLPLQETEQS